MLSVEHVTKKYGTFTALEDVNLTFENGVYGLLAPNGAGKTTLIKMLTTLLFPTSGAIRWNGEEISALGETYRGLLGYLPQEAGYYKNYTPVQFLKYIAALQYIDRRTAETRISQLLELVSLTDVRNKKMRQFSGGMIQRVGIAQAMMQDWTLKSGCASAICFTGFPATGLLFCPPTLYPTLRQLPARLL